MENATILTTDLLSFFERESPSNDVCLHFEEFFNVPNSGKNIFVPAKRPQPTILPSVMLSSFLAPHFKV